MKNYSLINGLYTLEPIKEGTDVLVLDAQSSRYQWLGKAKKAWTSDCKDNLHVELSFEDNTTDLFQRRSVRPVTITH